MIPVSLVLLLVEAVARLLSKRRKLRELVLPLVTEAALDGRLPDNAARREWVVQYLTKEHGMSESAARLLTEAGVSLWKKLQRKKHKKSSGM